MGKEIEFPARAVRNWEEVRPTVEKTLVEEGLPPDGIEKIMERAKQAWLKYDEDYRIELSLPMPPTTTPQQAEEIETAVRRAMGEVEKQFQSAMHRMFVDRIGLEIELYLARNPYR